MIITLYASFSQKSTTMIATPEEKVLVGRILEGHNFKAFIALMGQPGGNREIARYSDIDLMSEYKLAYSVFILDVCPPTPTFKFRYAGTGIKNIVGFEPTSQFVEDIMVADNMGEISSCYRNIIANKKPYCLVQPITFESTEATLSKPDGKQLMARLAFPLLDDNDNVGHIIGVLENPDYRDYPIKRFVTVPYDELVQEHK
jgi:hypothetical protein